MAYWRVTAANGSVLIVFADNEFEAWLKASDGNPSFAEDGYKVEKIIGWHGDD